MKSAKTGGQESAPEESCHVTRGYVTALIAGFWIFVSVCLCSCSGRDSDGEESATYGKEFDFTVKIVDGKTDQPVSGADVFVAIHPDDLQSAGYRARSHMGTSDQAGEVVAYVLLKGVAKPRLRGLLGYEPEYVPILSVPTKLFVTCDGYESLLAPIPVGLTTVDFEFAGTYDAQNAIWTISLEPVEESPE
jgi:hypothetical protein